jgi:cytochrome P450
MEIIATLGIGLLLAFSLWIISALYRNYRIAQSTGLPLLVSPINPVNPVWILLRPYINPLFSQLPFKIGYFAQYNYLGWEWHDKNQLHTIYGPVFMIVTPTENHLILADKAACEYVFKHIRDWQMNPAFNAPLEIFGSNVGTAEGHAWQRQRRITGMAFNERNSNLVWDESTKQAAQVLRSWIQAPPSKGVTTTVTDANLLALHVLAGAGFGITYDFESPLTAVTPGHAMSYRDALQALLDNIFITFAISMLRVPSFSLPYAMRRVLTAMKEFKLYTAEMVENERAVYARSNGSSKVNLLSSIVRASVEAANSKSDGIMGTLTRGSLSDEEILGNLFAFNVAGQDTTASTISYAIALLACHPAYQRWLKEELDRVFGTKGIQNFQYEDVYPRLKRCQAVMVRDSSELV